MGVSKKTITVIVIIGIIALAVGSGIFFASYIQGKLDQMPTDAGQPVSVTDVIESSKARESDLETNEAAKTIEYNGDQYVLNENLDVILFAGIDDDKIVDHGEGADASRYSAEADFLMVAVIDNSTKQYSLLQIDRNTMTDIMKYDYFGTYQGLEKDQIGQSHTYRTGIQPPCEDTVFAVSNLLYGIEIDYYFCLSMDAIPVLNHSVGGVKVRIEDDFSKLDPTLVKNKSIVLNDEQAEIYVRAGADVDNDPTLAGRMNRQATYLKTVLQMISEQTRSDENFAPNLFNDLLPYMVTDFTTDQLDDYCTKLADYRMTDIIVPEGEFVQNKDGSVEFNADEQSLRAIVIDLFYIKQ